MFNLGQHTEILRRRFLHRKEKESKNLTTLENVRQDKSELKFQPYHSQALEPWAEHLTFQVLTGGSQCLPYTVVVRIRDAGYKVLCVDYPNFTPSLEVRTIILSRHTNGFSIREVFLVQEWKQ